MVGGIATDTYEKENNVSLAVAEAEAVLSEAVRKYIASAFLVARRRRLLEALFLAFTS